MRIISGHDVDPAHTSAVQQYRWNVVPVGQSPRDGYGAFLGFVARSYGSYQPGGNPVLHGPNRATLAEAQADAADPTRVLFHVVGYLCG